MKKVLKSELLKENSSLRKKINILEKEIKKLNEKHFEIKNIDSENSAIKAIASVEVLNPNFLILKFSYLKKLIKSYEYLFSDDKDRFKIIFDYERPVIVGEYDKKTKTAIGFVLAPIVDGDDE